MSRIFSLYAFALLLSGLPELLIASQGISLAGGLSDFALAAAVTSLFCRYQGLSPQQTLPIAALIGLVQMAQPLLEVMVIAAAMQGFALCASLIAHRSVPKSPMVSFFVIALAHLLVKHTFFLTVGYFNLSAWAFIAVYLFVMLTIVVSHSNFSPTHHTTPQWRPARPF